MKKKNLQNLRSLNNLEHEVEETYLLIQALETQAFTTKEFLELIKAKDRPGYKEFKKFLEISDKQINKLNELGFIALFANFECFVFELLKDLFKKYPTSFKSEKIAKFEDIKDFKNIKEVKDFFIDSLAIEKSYDIERWANLLLQKFGIAIFKKKKELSLLLALNSLRNIIMHSGSKTTSKFRKEMKSFIKVPVPIGKPFKPDMKKYFTTLYNILRTLIKNIKKS